MSRPTPRATGKIDWEGGPLSRKRVTSPTATWLLLAAFGVGTVLVIGAVIGALLYLDAQRRLQETQTLDDALQESSAERALAASVAQLESGDTTFRGAGGVVRFLLPPRGRRDFRALVRPGTGELIASVLAFDRQDVDLYLRQGRPASSALDEYDACAYRATANELTWLDEDSEPALTAGTCYVSVQSAVDVPATVELVVLLSEYDESVPPLQALVEFERIDPAHLTELALLYSDDAEQVGLAERTARKALGGDPQDGVAQLQLLRARQLQGRPINEAEARALFRAYPELLYDGPPAVLDLPLRIPVPTGRTYEELVELAIRVPPGLHALDLSFEERGQPGEGALDCVGYAKPGLPYLGGGADSEVEFCLLHDSARLEVQGPTLVFLRVRPPVGEDTRQITLVVD